MGVTMDAGAPAKDGLRSYYKAKIEEYEIAVRNKTQNLRRLEAQRNELNTKGAWTTRSNATKQQSVVCCLD